MRLIDADATLDAIEAAWEKQRRGKTLHDQSVCAGIAEAERIVQRVPTIDAAPVVRCKDCVLGDTDGQRDPSGLVYCDHLDMLRGPEFYCAAGERRQDAPERAGKDGRDG